MVCDSILTVRYFVNFLVRPALQKEEWNLRDQRKDLHDQREDLGEQRK